MPFPINEKLICLNCCLSPFLVGPCILSQIITRCWLGYNCPVYNDYLDHLPVIVGRVIIGVSESRFPWNLSAVRNFVACQSRVLRFPMEQLANVAWAIQNQQKVWIFPHELNIYQSLQTTFGFIHNFRQLPPNAITLKPFAAPQHPLGATPGTGSGWANFILAKQTSYGKCFPLMSIPMHLQDQSYALLARATSLIS